ncbi:glycosyltransferase [Thomasclavelia saccharogumia]|uniref:glycosyltransferase n=1 Tax=Thomasclavelia saccharogumia TaxID=341225 RepID=UPI00047E51D3|nr:glycosyltransferase [Thomasclavelia saccharogumia]
MNILYLSSLCSVKEYKRIMQKYGTISSHASQKFNRLIIDGLIKNGCKINVISQRIILNSKKEDLRISDDEENGIKYKYIPNISNKKLNRIYVIFKSFFYIKRWLKENKDGYIICDIILGELSIALFLISLIYNVKTTAIVTDVPNIRAGDKRNGIRAIPVKIKNSMINYFDSYIFLTMQMNKKLNKKNKPFVIIEGIVDSGVIDEPNDLEKKYSEKVCIMAGLLEEVFGVELLVNAFKKIKCLDARLYFYGKGGSVDYIKKVSRYDSRIQYKGELTNDQMIIEEKKASLLINPRLPNEKWTAYSFPSKNMEYISSGTPLVAFDLPCIPTEYHPYFYKIVPENIEGMEKILDELLHTNSKELNLFGKKAQKWIVKHKNSKVQMKKYIDMMENIVR